MLNILIKFHNKLIDTLNLILSSVLLTSLIGCSTKNQDLYADLTAEQIYYQGKQNIKKGKFSEAVKDFEALESGYPYGDYSDRAKLSLMYACYSTKDYPQVKAVAERLLKMHPNYRYADYAHYMYGVAGYDQYYSTVYRVFNIDRSKRESSLAIESFDAFKTLLERFPNSKYAVDAKQRMVNLRNQIAANELHIAKYYLAREAYLAAANRAYTIITDLNGTLAVEEALKVMASAYQKLGMTDFERNSINLINNFKTVNVESAKK